MVDEEFIKELSDEYGVGIPAIKKYCETLLSYPIVRSEDDSFFNECLEILVSERSSQAFMRSDQFKTSGKSGYLENVERCLYRIYGDDAIPYLSDSFKATYGLEDEYENEDKMSL